MDLQCLSLKIHMEKRHKFVLQIAIGTQLRLILLFEHKLGGFFVVPHSMLDILLVIVILRLMIEPPFITNLGNLTNQFIFIKITPGIINLKKVNLRRCIRIDLHLQRLLVELMQIWCKVLF